MLDDLNIESVLLSFGIFILIVIFFFVYNDSSKSNVIQDKIDNLKLDCPKCPDIPKCPDMKCPNITQKSNDISCPDCPTCPDIKCPDCPTCPEKPECPVCPNVNYPTVNDIVSGIFPGRDPGLTLTGEYFPVQGYVQNTPKSSDEAEIINGNSQFQDIQGGENTQNINDQSN